MDDIVYIKYDKYYNYSIGLRIQSSQCSLLLTLTVKIYAA